MISWSLELEARDAISHKHWDRQRTNRVYLKKEPHQFVTVHEFAAYCGLNVEDLLDYLD